MTIAYTIVTSMLIFIVTTGSALVTRENLYIPGKELSSRDLYLPITNETVKSQESCAVRCLNMESSEFCKSWLYDDRTQQCTFFKISIPEDSTRVSPVFTLELKSKWFPLLEADDGCGENIYQLWIDREPKVGQGFYYNGGLIRERWPDFKQVRLSMITSGLVMASVTFDATTSDFISWFSMENVITGTGTTYTDLNPINPPDYFGIEGFVNSNVVRRFLVNKGMGGCSGDNGWFMVLDIGHPMVHCIDYESNIPGPLPHFIYCPGPTYCTYAGERQVADKFLIEATEY